MPRAACRGPIGGQDHRRLVRFSASPPVVVNLPSYETDDDGEEERPRSSPVFFSRVFSDDIRAGVPSRSYLRRRSYPNSDSTSSVAGDALHQLQFLLATTMHPHPYSSEPRHLRCALRRCCSAVMPTTLSQRYSSRGVSSRYAALTARSNKVTRKRDETSLPESLLFMFLHGVSTPRSCHQRAARSASPSRLHTDHHPPASRARHPLSPFLHLQVAVHLLSGRAILRRYFTAAHSSVAQSIREYSTGALLTIEADIVPLVGAEQPNSDIKTVRFPVSVGSPMLNGCGCESCGPPVIIRLFDNAQTTLIVGPTTPIRLCCPPKTQLTFRRVEAFHPGQFPMHSLGHSSTLTARLAHGTKLPSVNLDPDPCGRHSHCVGCRVSTSEPDSKHGWSIMCCSAWESSSVSRAHRVWQVVHHASVTTRQGIRANYYPQLDRNEAGSSEPVPPAAAAMIDETTSLTPVVDWMESGRDTRNASGLRLGVDMPSTTPFYVQHDGHIFHSSASLALHCTTATHRYVCGRQPFFRFLERPSVRRNCAEQLHHLGNDNLATAAQQIAEFVTELISTFSTTTLLTTTRAILNEVGRLSVQLSGTISPSPTTAGFSNTSPFRQLLALLRNSGAKQDSTFSPSALTNEHFDALLHVTDHLLADHETLPSCLSSFNTPHNHTFTRNYHAALQRLLSASLDILLQLQYPCASVVAAGVTHITPSGLDEVLFLMLRLSERAGTIGAGVETDQTIPSEIEMHSAISTGTSRPSWEQSVASSPGAYLLDGPALTAYEGCFVEESSAFSSASIAPLHWKHTAIDRVLLFVEALAILGLPSEMEGNRA